MLYHEVFFALIFVFNNTIHLTNITPKSKKKKKYFGIENNPLCFIEKKAKIKKQNKTNKTKQTDKKYHLNQVFSTIFKLLPFHTCHMTEIWQGHLNLLRVFLKT